MRIERLTTPWIARAEARDRKTATDRLGRRKEILVGQR
jgi:hypothetical protein